MTRKHTFILISLALFLWAPVGAVQAAGATDLAGQIMNSEAVRPGLYVHLGIGDGTLTAALSGPAGSHVLGLSDDPAVLETARKTIQAAGVYGNRVAVDQCSFGNLPLAHDTVNLVIAEQYPQLEARGLALVEIMRMVCPGGVVLLGGATGINEKLDFKIVQIGGQAWLRIVKPAPAGMDEWQQYQHDATRTGVSHDQLAGPPAGLRWAGGFPFLTTKQRGDSTLVTANGRIFYRITDASKASGRIAARDAYNGILLWQFEVEKLPPEEAFAAAGDLVYAVLDGSCAILDARTGKRLTDLGADASSLTLHGGILIIKRRASETGGRIAAFDPVTGKPLWESAYNAAEPIVATGNMIYCLNSAGARSSTALACLDLKTGRQIWEVPVKGNSLTWFGGVLFVSDIQKKTEGRMTFQAFSDKDGRLLWEKEFPSAKGIYTRMLFADGLAWVCLDREQWQGFDPKMGEMKKELKHDNTMRGRCGLISGTDRYLIVQNMCFLDAVTGQYHDFFAGRGHCASQNIPAQGLLFQIPDRCCCYPKINGFAAFTARSADEPRAAPAKGSRLIRGPAFGKVPTLAVTAADWPTFRHDPARSGSTAAAVPDGSKVLWQADLKGGVTAPSAVGNLVLTAVPERHQVVALDAATGALRWSFTASGPVDSPPTIHDGLALFGCRDGRVYALAAADGTLAWKFMAAPVDRRIMAHEAQLESVWPVCGSVLVRDGTAYFAAGRHTDLDGGIRLYAADPATGQVRWEEVVNRSLFNETPMPPSGYQQPMVMNDILSADGSRIYMSTAQFDPATGAPHASPAGLRMFGGRLGFLHDSIFGTWQNRGHLGKGSLVAENFLETEKRTWVYSASTTFYSSGAVLSGVTSGNNLAVSGDRVFGIQRKSGPPHIAFLDQIVDQPRKNRVWEKELPFMPVAMLLAGERVAVAGRSRPEGREEYQGHVLLLKADTGEQAGELTIKGLPYYSGLAAAQGRLFVATSEGILYCIGK